MCASYGLEATTYAAGAAFGLDPLDDGENRGRILDWAAARNGRAAITGSKARNLNPVILAGSGGERSLEFGWWWIWLGGGGPVKFSAFNSRDDRLMESWRGPFQHRAILPASWYVEKGHRFTLPGGELFGIAAITSTVTEVATGRPLLTYSMVTRDAVGEAASAHPRMPLVLPRDAHSDWLAPERAGDASLVAEMQHASGEIALAMTTGGQLPL